MSVIRTILTVIYFVIALIVIILALIKTKDDSGLSQTITTFMKKIKVELKKENKKE